MNFKHNAGETDAVLLGLLLMEINISKLKSKVQKKYAKAYQPYCSNYLPLFWKKRKGLYFPGL